MYKLDSLEAKLKKSTATLKPEKLFVCRDRGTCSDSAGFGRGWTVWGDRLLSEPADASDWCPHGAGSTAQIGVQAGDRLGWVAEGLACSRKANWARSL